MPWPPVARLPGARRSLSWSLPSDHSPSTLRGAAPCLPTRHLGAAVRGHLPCPVFSLESVMGNASGFKRGSPRGRWSSKWSFSILLAPLARASSGDATGHATERETRLAGGRFCEPVHLDVPRDFYRNIQAGSRGSDGPQARVLQDPWPDREPVRTQGKGPNPRRGNAREESRPSAGIGPGALSLAWHGRDLGSLEGLCLPYFVGIPVE